MKTLLPLITLATFTFIGCEEDSCKFCYTQVTDNETKEITYSKETEYCDVDLDAKENQDPIVLDGTTSKWICE